MAVRGEQVQDRFQVVDGVQVNLHEVAVLAGDPVALGDVRDLAAMPGISRSPAAVPAAGPGQPPPTAGVAALTAVRITGQPLGFVFVFTFANCALFLLYIVLGHRIASEGGPSGIDRLGAAMLVAAAIATPWGLGGALPAFGHPVLLLAGAGVGVGVCSSVIQDVAAVTLVVLGVAVHREQRKELSVEYVRLGSTGLKVSRICLGMMRGALRPAPGPRAPLTERADSLAGW
jgi:hypothetical protein